MQAECGFLCVLVDSTAGQLNEDKFALPALCACERLSPRPSHYIAFHSWRSSRQHSPALIVRRHPPLHHHVILHSLSLASEAAQSARTAWELFICIEQRRVIHQGRQLYRDRGGSRKLFFFWGGAHWT